MICRVLITSTGYSIREKEDYEKLPSHQDPILDAVMRVRTNSYTNDASLPTSTSCQRGDGDSTSPFRRSLNTNPARMVNVSWLCVLISSLRRHLFAEPWTPVLANPHLCSVRELRDERTARPPTIENHSTTTSRAMATEDPQLAFATTIHWLVVRKLPLRHSHDNLHSCDD